MEVAPQVTPQVTPHAVALQRAWRGNDQGKASVFKNFVALTNRRAPMEEQTPFGKPDYELPNYLEKVQSQQLAKLLSRFL